MFTRPALRVFLQIDSVDYEHQINWYSYVKNGPFNLVYPLGVADVTPELVNFFEMYVKAHADGMPSRIPSKFAALEVAYRTG